MVDKTKGYQLNINTQNFSELFNVASGVYEVKPNRKTKILDEDLRDRETFVIKSVGDIVKVMERGEFDRLQKSRVVFRNKAVDWQDFFIHYAKEDRYSILLKRLQKRKPGDDQIFCVMEIVTDKMHGAGFGYRKPVASQRIAIGKNDRGGTIYIAPQVFLNNDSDMYVRDSLLKPGSHLVMGIVRLHTKEGDRATFHNLSITVTDRAQVMDISIQDIHNEAKQRAARRQARDMGHMPGMP